MSKTDEKDPNILRCHLPFNVLQHTNLSILPVIEWTILAHGRRVIASSQDHLRKQSDRSQVEGCA